MRDWTGLIVEDGLLDMSVMDHVGLLEKRTKELGISGAWEVMEVSVKPSELKRVVSILKKGLRPAWYAYFKRGDKIIIVFKDKVFNISKKSKLSLKRVENWAFKKYNVLPTSLNFNL